MHEKGRVPRTRHIRPLLPLATARALVAIKQSVSRAIAQPQQAAELLALIIEDAQRGLDALGKSKPEAMTRPR
jgi:hypothetical protein